MELPYIPTTILFRSAGDGDGNENGNVVYIFSPSGSSGSRASVNLLSINITSTVDAGSAMHTLSTKLPFLESNLICNTTAFAPSIAGDGTIDVLVGDCQAECHSSLFWTYTPSSGEWTSHATTYGGDNVSSLPVLLGQSLSFSSQLAPTTSESITYVYGGMCPLANTTDVPWQAAAVYSNSMFKMEKERDSDAYIISALDTERLSFQPPIAEAGFSLTPLTPALANRAGTVTQERSFVLLGGHTESAFVNMSTAAMWSLPDEAWNFVAVANELDAVDSRSGHTAVLTEDGRSIVVLGGWVGDVDTSATPQLAVLRMGTTLSEWRWEVPGTKSQPSGGLIYGHGAATLPGNVMMVYGGYGTGGLSARAGKRTIGAVSSFLNLTSMTWSDEYINPSSTIFDSGGSTSSSGAQTVPTNTSPSELRNVDLRIGLGLGIAFLLSIAALGCCLWRRNEKERRRVRQAFSGIEEDFSPRSPVAGRGRDGHHFLPQLYEDADEHQAEVVERSHELCLSESAWYAGGMRNSPHASVSRLLGYESLWRENDEPSADGSSGGLYVADYGPSSSGSGKRAGRGHIHTNSTGTVSDHRSNMIHPIFEADENVGEDRNHARGGTENEHDHDGGGDLGMIHGEHENASSDSFMTPLVNAHSTPARRDTRNNSHLPASSSSSGGSSGSCQDHEVLAWVSDADAADAVLAAKIGCNGGGAGMSNLGGITPTTLPSLFATASSGGVRVSPSRWTKACSARFGEVEKSANTNSPTSADVGCGGDHDYRPGSTLPESESTASDASNRNLTAGTAIAGRSKSVPSHFRGAFGGPSAPSVPGMTPEATDARCGTCHSSSVATSSTARSVIATLQAEGQVTQVCSLEHRLPDERHNFGLAPSQQESEENPDLESSRDLYASYVAYINAGQSNGQDEELQDDIERLPDSPSKNKPRRYWLGSLRRVFSISNRTPSSTDSGRDNSAVSTSLHNGGGASRMERHSQQHLVRRKGRQAVWTGAEEASEPGAGSGAGEAQGDNERDIEREVEQRLVQVMFTVPKDKLRVVNAEIETLDGRSTISSDPDTDEGAAMAQALGIQGGSLDLGKGKEQEEDRLTVAEPHFRISWVSTSTATTGQMQTAEVVRLERPRTRVLQMVESIESMHGEDSNSLVHNPVVR